MHADTGHREGRGCPRDHGRLGEHGHYRGPPRREGAAVAGAFERTEVRQSCASHNRLRKPYFGDLHVHTAYSVDAAVVAVSTGPRDAYRFAQGEEIGLPPFDPTGAPVRHARLSRPLDFNAVTDHAEFFGEMDICLNRPERRGSTSTLCTLTRNDVATFSDPATPARPRGPPGLIGNLGALQSPERGRAAPADQRLRGAEGTGLVGRSRLPVPGGQRSLRHADDRPQLQPQSG